MTGTIHLSVINNQYEETTIHMVGEGYEDDITLDNIHGLVTSTSQEASDISEVMGENTVEDLVAGERSSSEVLTTVGSWATFNSMKFESQITWLSGDSRMSLLFINVCSVVTGLVTSVSHVFLQGAVYVYTEHQCTRTRHYPEPWGSKE